MLLLAAVVLAYQPAWRAGFIWDDNVYVTLNPLLIAPDGLRRIWFTMDSPSQYFPLTYTVFRLEHGLWGLNPGGYHWVNILLHATNALLLWRLLKRLAIPGAWLAAAIFALHPVNVEAVAWVTELKSVLSLFFILLALVAWAEFVEEQSRQLWRWYGLAVIFCALALFAKTTACTLSAAMLLIIWLEKKPINGLRLVQIAPFLAMGVGMGLVSIWWERYHVGTRGQMFSQGLAERTLVASHAIWFYLGKLVWPVNLAFIYPKWTLHPADPLAWGWVAACVGLGVAIGFIRRFAGKSIEVATFFYVAMLSPLLGFIMLYTFRYTYVADHYQYTAAIGPIALAAAGMALLFRKTNQYLKFALCAGLLLTLGALTWQQCQMYADAETLWRATIKKNPDCWMAYNNLGFTVFKEGRVDEAMADYQKALEINPNDFVARNNLGQALLQTGQPKAAMTHFQTALEINPNYFEACDNLGQAFLQIGQLKEAIAQYQKAMQINPDDGAAYTGLGIALFQAGQYNEAMAQFQTALKISPESASVHNNLGLALSHAGQQDAAISEYEKAIELDPQFIDAQNNLAWALATGPETSLRDSAKAIALAEHLNQLTRGKNPAYLDTLAAAYADAGRFGDAIGAAQQAMALAQSAQQAGLAAQVQERLKLYQAGRPFHEPVAGTP